MHGDPEERLFKMYTDMYLGDGKENPSMTTRMKIVEEAQERLSSNLNKLTWVAVTTLATVVGEIVIKLFK